VERFTPGSDERAVWPTFGATMARRLRRAARVSENSGLQRLAEAVSVLRTAPAYEALDGRRGMDYHRRRPQSVAHTAPRAGTVSTTNGVTTFRMVAPQLDADASADVVHSVAVAALETVTTSMRDIRRAIPDAVRGEQINYAYDFVPESTS
jgi:hypothetical protein